MKSLSYLIRFIFFASTYILVTRCQQVPSSPTQVIFPATPRPTYTPEPSLYTSWKGLHPGKTTQDETLALLGQPNRTLDSSPFLIYGYDDRPEWGWKFVEVWFQQINEQWIISAIFFPIQYSERGVSVIPSQVMLLLNEYGRPTKVTWARSSGNRYWIWPEVGVAVQVSQELRSLKGVGWNRAEYSELLLFKPMRLEEFLGTEWPWQFSSSGFSHENLFTGKHGDFIDSLPEDPYDWATIPTPTP